MNYDLLQFLFIYHIIRHNRNSSKNIQHLLLWSIFVLTKN